MNYTRSPRNANAPSRDEETTWAHSPVLTCFGQEFFRSSEPGSIAHVVSQKSQKVSVAFGKSLILFLFLGLLVECLEVGPEGEDHDDAQPVGSNANRVRVPVTLTPGHGPDVGTPDIA